MPVLFVAHTAEHGGAEMGLARYLTSPDRGTAAELVVLAGEGLLIDEASSAGVPARTLGPAVRRPWALLRRSGRLRAALKQSGADVVVANDYHAAVLLALLPKDGRRLVFYMRNGLRRNPRRLITWVVVTRVLLRRFDAFIANSAWTHSTLPPALRKRPNALAYPVSGDPHSQAAEVAPSGVLRVLSLSRLAPWKGISVLAEAVKLVGATGEYKVHLAIAGSGEEEYAARLLEDLAKTDVEWTYHGHVRDVAPLLAEADVLVCPSIEPEPFGQVIVQGLSAGRLVVATDAGGAREILSGCEAGYLVPPADAAELAAALRTIADLPHDERVRRGRLGRSSVERFSDRVTVAMLDDALRSITPKP